LLHQLLNKLEKQKSGNMDLAASTFYDMLSFVGAGGVNEEREKRVVYEILKNVGRWIYILDAYNDLEDDFKEGNYNPLIYRYNFLSQKESIQDFMNRIKAEVEFTLNQSLFNLSNAYELLSDDEGGILKNIVYLGLPQKQHGILYQKGRKENESV
jgi:hypothetical protein